MTVSGTAVLRRTRWGRSQASQREIPGGSVERMISSNSTLAEGLLDGLHRVRVAEGAVGRGTHRAETGQFRAEVGLRLGYALIASAHVGRTGQKVGVDGEGATERVEVIDEMGGRSGRHEHPELGWTAGHPVADCVEQLLTAESVVGHH